MPRLYHRSPDGLEDRRLRGGGVPPGRVSAGRGLTGVGLGKYIIADPGGVYVDGDRVRARRAGALSARRNAGEGSQAGRIVVIRHGVDRACYDC